MTFLPQERILAQQIKGKAIRHDVFRRHRASLVCVIILLIERIVTPHILVQTDSQNTVSNNDRLIQGRNLCINLRNRQLMNFFFQVAESLCQTLFKTAHVLKLLSHIFHQMYQYGIRKISTQTVIHVYHIHRTQIKHFLYQ